MSTVHTAFAVRSSGDCRTQKELSDVLSAREKLKAAPSSVSDPIKSLVASALDGHAGADRVDKLLERTAIARLVAAERVSLDQRVEPELLNQFGKRLETGGADEVLDLLRPQFSAAADTLQAALSTIGGFPDDAEAFMNTATGEQLVAYQSVAPAIVALDKVGLIAAAFGPTGAFPVVTDPRRTDPGLRCGWLHSTAVMCCSNDLLHACAEFQKPSPLGDVRSNPWLRVGPHLHTVASAAERLRGWAETDWAAQEAQRPAGGRMINGTMVPDPPRRNPFARQGMTMIVVTHEMGFARKAANRVVFMDDGLIVEEADPESFFTNAQSSRAKDFLSKILTH